MCPKDGATKCHEGLFRERWDYCQLDSGSYSCGVCDITEITSSKYFRWTLRMSDDDTGSWSQWRSQQSLETLPSESKSLPTLLCYAASWQLSHGAAWNKLPAVLDSANQCINMRKFVSLGSLQSSRAGQTRTGTLPYSSKIQLTSENIET